MIISLTLINAIKLSMSVQEFMYDEQGQWLLITSDQHPCFMIMASVDNTSGPVPQRKERCTLQCALSSKEEKSSCFIYQNKDKKNRLMRIDELHKFSDGTLNDVQTAFDDRLKGIRMKYLPQSIWRQSDRDKAGAMIQAIDKQDYAELEEICWWETVRGRLLAATKDHMIYHMMSSS
ncbi:hypothetical protein Tco_0507819 [Tanacetum coccineum]